MTTKLQALRENAKSLGVKKYYKLNKYELITAIIVNITAKEERYFDLSLLEEKRSACVKKIKSVLLNCSNPHQMTEVFCDVTGLLCPFDVSYDDDKEIVASITAIALYRKLVRDGLDIVPYPDTTGMTDKKTKIETFRVKLGEFVETEKKSFALYDAINWDAIDWYNMTDTERAQTTAYQESYQAVIKLGSILRNMFIAITGRKIAIRDFYLLLRTPAKILDIINA